MIHDQRPGRLQLIYRRKTLSPPDFLLSINWRRLQACSFSLWGNDGRLGWGRQDVGGVWSAWLFHHWCKQNILDATRDAAATSVLFPFRVSAIFRFLFLFLLFFFLLFSCLVYSLELQL